MNKISELKQILSDKLKWNKARLDCFVRMLFALFSVRTVNLSEMALGFESKAEAGSRYKRMQRFFCQFKIDYSVVARWIFSLFFSGSESLYLTIDRTNWFWGKAKINILMLGIAYEGASIPLLWNLLNKAGNATAVEHQGIIERFMRLFGSSCIKGILCDREFASGELFDFCNKQGIPFYIRIKEGSIVRINDKKLCKVEKLFSHLNPKEKYIFNMRVEIFGQKVYLEGSRSEKGELMVIATNQHPRNAVAIYLRRWEIETLFACLKGRGFRFEDTHMTHLDRIEKLIFLLTVGFCWAHKTGEWRAIQKPIPMKKHRQSLRPQNSFFRYGFDFIRELILNPYRKISMIIPCLRLFRPDDSLQKEASL
jgi:Transposase DDE domain